MYKIIKKYIMNNNYDKKYLLFKSLLVVVPSYYFTGQ